MVILYLPYRVHLASFVTTLLKQLKYVTGTNRSNSYVRHCAVPSSPLIRSPSPHVLLCPTDGANFITFSTSFRLVSSALQRQRRSKSSVLSFVFWFQLMRSALLYEARFNSPPFDLSYILLSPLILIWRLRTRCNSNWLQIIVKMVNKSCEGKGHPRTGHEGPEGEYSCTFL